MLKCKLCGGSCDSIGGDKYQCDCCGNIFSEEDFVSVKKSILTPLNDSGAEVFQKNVDGVLEIRWRTEQGICSGSGFLINSLGYAVTNAHVVAQDNGKSCGICTVKLAGENCNAKVIAMGTENTSKHCSVDDLAIIKLDVVPLAAKVLRFENYENVRTGEKVFVIGNSLGQGTCITSGIVSDRMRGGELMTDCPINGGNSGGPIFNEKGFIIGAIVAGLTNAEGMNFAIPSNVIMEFLNKNGIRF